MSPPDLDVAPTAEVRAIGDAWDHYVYDPDGSVVDGGPAIDTRLRLGAVVSAPVGPERSGGTVRAAVEADLFSGQLLGPTWSLPTVDERGRDAREALTLAGVVPRRALVGFRGSWFDAQLGLDTSRWGLGMLANDGAQDPLFGRTDLGDRVLRLRFATAPQVHPGSPLVIVLAGDHVVADELAVWADGDDAWQAVAAVLYRHPSVVQGVFSELGMYGVARDQRATDPFDPPTADRRHTAVQVLDLVGTLPVVFEPLLAELSAEGAAITGHTDASRTYAAPEGVDVRSWGLAARAVLRPIRSADWAVHLRAALASGDTAPDDGTLGDFRFDRDYDVGFVLFDEVLAAYDLGAYRQATDPALAVVPPDGIDALAAEGAFHQAAALQPAVVAAPVPWLELRLGAVIAWSTSPIAQPYATFRAGGAPTNALGQPSGEGRLLGTELDWAIATREAPIASWTVRPSVELQVGHAWPSAAVGDPGRVDRLLLAVRARY